MIIKNINLGKASIEGQETKQRTRTQFFSLNLTLKIFLLFVVIIPIVSPLVANAQEPIEDVKTKISIKKEEADNNIKNNKKETRATSEEAKNVAYGEDSSGSVDNGVGTIDVNSSRIGAIDYKIDAMTHEVTVRLNTDQDIYSDDFTFALNIEDESGNTVVIDEDNDDTDPSDGYIKDLTTGASGTLDLEISTGSLEAQGFDREGQYNIYFTNTKISDTTIVDVIEINMGSVLLTSLNIGVPKTLLKDSVLYSVVGDNVNKATDIDDVIASDKIEPGDGSSLTSGTPTTTTYGIFELESIGYEAANPSTSTASTSKADWSESDLTLAKYDHVIRPADGNYLIGTDIDGTATDESTPTLDNVGGWSTDGVANDGYRPIGQVIGTTGGADSIAFTGQITGNVDEICGVSDCTDASGTAVDYTNIDNTYVSDIFISEPEIDNVGMLSVGNDAQINNLGIVNPTIEGRENVGSFVGQIGDSDLSKGEGSELLNVYTLETVEHDVSGAYDIIGSEYTGGIAGVASNTTIGSEGVFEGVIPGIDLSADTQPNKTNPDKDGYKTFSTVDVLGESNTGGIVAQATDVDVTRVYVKGALKGGVVGGIISDAVQIKINNAYYKSEVGIESDAGAGGIVYSIDGISGEGSSSVISNVYNESNIKASNNVGGIVGTQHISDLTISNAINMGNIQTQSGSSLTDTFGGIIGLVGVSPLPNDGLITVENVINIGNIESTDTTSLATVGGVVGTVNGLKEGSTVKNALNIGNLTVNSSGGAGSIVGVMSVSAPITLETLLDNTYSYRAIIITGPSDLMDTITDPAKFKKIDVGNLNDVDWWKNTLFQGVEADYSNFNIDEKDAIATTSPSDSATCETDGNDESCDNALGQVNREYYPTVKETDGTVALESEVPEQNNTDIIKPEFDVIVNNYKINAINLDIYLNMTVPEEVGETRDGTINVYEGDYSGTATLPGSIDYPLTYTVGVGENLVTIPGTSSGYDIKADQDYTIDIENSYGVKIERLVIHTPKQITMDYDINQDDTIDPDSEKNLVFSVIGDNVNQNTFISSTTMTDTTHSKPTGGVNADNVYGIYELESIAYEEANQKGDLDSDTPSDWTDTDLTLVKYDHIIRPSDGRYAIVPDADGNPSTPAIDASVVDETPLTLDKVGGWSTDSDGDDVADTKDGYRPIGFNLDYSKIANFDGVLTSTTSEVASIKDLYINLPTYERVGLISTLSGNISNIGLDVSDVDKVYITGMALGGITALNHGKINNSYATGDVQGGYSVGGLVGFNSGEIDNSYATGDVSGEEYVGGLVGVQDGVIANSHATGNVQGNDTVGGLVGFTFTGIVMNSYATGAVSGKNWVGGLVGSQNGTLRNSYATGAVSGENWVGGLVGQASSDDIINTYATGNVQGQEQVGGLVGLMTESVVVKNSYATGDVIGEVNVGGLVGHLNDSTLINSYAAGNVTGKGTVAGLVARQYGEVVNSYAYEAQQITNNQGTSDPADDVTVPIDDTNIIATTDTTTSEVYIATYNNLIDAGWYNNSTAGSGLGWISDGIYDGTNDIGSPAKEWTAPWGPNFDASKEYCMPHVMNDIEEDEDVSNNDGTYVPEQPCVEIVNSDPYSGMRDYKINAITLDIIIKIEEATDIGVEDIKIEELDSTGIVANTTTTSISPITDTSGTYIKIDGVSNSIKANTTYQISRLNQRIPLKIITPKQVEYDRKTYALIGDGVNSPTDVEDAFDSDKIEPGSGSDLASGTKTTANYGIYELESIAYEEANSKDSTASISKADWSENDLTLAKYDHIIRPRDGNYLIGSNIDATATNESTPLLDKDGGWSTDGVENDGFRPIGQIVGTPDGTVAIPFTGQITGNVDEICGVSKCTDSSGLVIDSSGIENTYISNLYINEPNINNVGMISQGDDAIISNLGIIDPSITGNSKVGSFAGQMLDSATGEGDGSQLLNVYTIDSDDESTSIDYDIKSEETSLADDHQGAGGIAGEVYNTTISSDSRFEGKLDSVPGISLPGSSTQPSDTDPDVDGYKTFNTLDVENANTMAGGLVGYAENSTINNVYNKGSVKSFDTVGGILGESQSTDIQNTYNKSNDFYVDHGNVGGILGYGRDVPDTISTTVSNSFNSADISIPGKSGPTDSQGYSVGGIVGAPNSTSLKNVYNIGDIKGGYAVGGIIGNNTEPSLTTLENAYNAGNIKATAVWDSTTSTDEYYLAPVVGGIAGGLMPRSGSYIKNVLNTGDIEATSSSIKEGFVGSVIGTKLGDPSIISNSYYLSSAEVTPKDTVTSHYSALTAVATNIISGEAGVTWWKGTLFEDQPSIYNNFNIDANDAVLPDPNGAVSDENTGVDDDTLGQVNLGYYPTIKEIDGAGWEVPEQFSKTMGEATEIIIDDYKINAVSLDFILHYSLPTSLKGKSLKSQEKLIQEYANDLVIERADGTPLTCRPIAKPEHSTIEIINDTASSDCNIKQDTVYTVSHKAGMSYIDSEGDVYVLKNPFTLSVHTPRQETKTYDIDGNGTIEESERDVTYALIGDGVNHNSYVESNIEKLDGGQATPYFSGDPSIDTTKTEYGVYELESIGYEEKLLTDGAGFQYDDWNPRSSLTLGKYNHIIRPLDGNYMQVADIDASATLETTPKLDVDGGWTPDIDRDGVIDLEDVPDGFAPVGGTTYGINECTYTDIFLCAENDNYYFTGNYIVDDSENPVIKNMYIDITNATGHIGIFAGVEKDPTVSGVSGVINGIETEVTDPSKYFISGKVSPHIWDAYTIKPEDRTVAYNIRRTYAVGGVVGDLKGGGVVANVTTSSSVKALSRFNYIEGGTTISGVPLDPSQFKILDNAQIGGIVGQAAGTIRNCEATSDVKIESTLEKAKYMGEIKVDDGTDPITPDIYPDGARMGGIVGRGKNVTIENCISNADIEGGNFLEVPEYSPLDIGIMANTDVGGIAGSLRGDIYNSYATGNVTGSGNNVGGLIGYFELGKVSEPSYDIYATGDVKGLRDNVGGLIGNVNLYTGKGVINRAYSTGKVEGDNYVGGLIGNNAISLENSYHITGEVIGSGAYVGGLVGGMVYGHIINSYAKSDVTGEYEVGGLTGMIISINDGIGHVPLTSNSYATGNVTGTGGRIGGLIGYLSGGELHNSYATGNVTGEYEVGGLVGRVSNDIINSYATGNVTGTGGRIGGLVGSTGGEANASTSFLESASKPPIINSIAFGDVAGGNFCTSSGYSYDCGVGAIVGNHGVKDTTESITAGVAGANPIINSYAYENQNITDVGSDGILGTSDDITKTVSNDMIAGDDLTINGSGSSITPFKPHIAAKSNLSSFAWWTNTTEGNGLNYNNYDVDDNATTSDDKYHWHMTNLGTSSAPIAPKVNGLEENTTDSSGDGYKTTSSSVMLDGQTDISISIIPFEVTQATQEIKEGQGEQSETPINVSQNQKDEDIRHQISNNSELADEEIIDEEIYPTINI